jgi:hypothetical protein
MQKLSHVVALVVISSFINCFKHGPDHWQNIRLHREWLNLKSHVFRCKVEHAPWNRFLWWKRKILLLFQHRFSSVFAISKSSKDTCGSVPNCPHPKIYTGITPRFCDFTKGICSMVRALLCIEKHETSDSIFHDGLRWVEEDLGHVKNSWSNLIWWLNYKQLRVQVLAQIFMSRNQKIWTLFTRHFANLLRVTTPRFWSYNDSYYCGPV